MKSKYVLISFITAFVIVSLYHIFAVGRFNYPEFRLKAGQVAEAELIAPFDFPLLKSPEQLTNERDSGVNAIPTPYRLNDEILFNSLSALDKVFSVFYRFPDSPPDQINLEMQKAGFLFETKDLDLKPSQREKLYDDLREQLKAIYTHGIYENIESDSISVTAGGTVSRISISKYYSLGEAKARLVESFPSYTGFFTSLAEFLVAKNLEIDEDLYTQFRQETLSNIPVTEGIVLKNEIIVRKNARISERDIEKLESLQSAYRNRDVHKSPLQQILLAIGMLIFVMLVLLLTNHYYSGQNILQNKSLADFIPVNLGFVLIVLFGIFSNHVFSLNNLLIPFAITAVCGAILVSMEFGILYAMASMLVLNPFINWETYTPVIFILSTLIALLFIKKNRAQHEYLSIWFYLMISTTLVNLAISIYKSDPVMVIFRNIGFGMISNSISIMGIMVIVPYYERKWNRATKQTLLELLDFNHPLLKKLATTAVGTYHHSLIVGNLAERAAEAIGANPLLARVGSYYHDIGKIVNTEIFTENNADSSDIHAEMLPDQSASLIKNHVLEGIILAKKYKIPQPVIDIVMQHHGNSIIRYFYDKAEKANQLSDLSGYQYPGPRPQTKEAALVMIADVVESTTKAKNITSAEDITKVIDDTISRLLKEGQFDEAPLTMRDISLVKETMLPVLQSIYRKRLDYPEEK